MLVRLPPPPAAAACRQPPLRLCSSFPLPGSWSQGLDKYENEDLIKYSLPQAGRRRVGLAARLVQDGTPAGFHTPAERGSSQLLLAAP